MLRDMLKQLRALLAIALIVASVGCEGGGTGPSTGEVTPPLGTLRADIDGSSRELVATAIRDITNDILTIGGEDAGFTVILALQAPAVVGTRSLPDPAVLGAYAGFRTYEEAGWAAYGAYGSGTVTIKSLTSTAVSGTFSFTLLPYGTATGTKVISNGSFNAPLVSD